MSQEEGTDAAILEAAQRLLAEHGSGFTMAQLAAESGVSRATLYRRVPSKEALAQRLREIGVEPGRGLGSTRERIFDAIRGLLAVHGLSFTVEQVAERAEVGLATVYRSFGDRDGLLHAFFHERGPRGVAAVRLRDLEAPVEQTLHPLVTSLLGFVVEYPGLARTVLLDQGPEAKEIERLRRGGRSTASRLVAYVEAQVKRGVLVGDPRLLASSLLGIVLGTSLLYHRVARSGGRGRALAPLSPDDPAGIEARAHEVVALWLRGASA